VIAIDVAICGARLPQEIASRVTGRR
jgi:hypothetical protein